MVTAVTIDPIKPSVLNLTAEEIEEIKGQIALGQLPADFLARCDEARARNVFGADYRTDAKGRPIEQGFGSESQMTVNSIAAYKKYGKDEPDYERQVARMEKLYAEQQERRRKAAGR